MCCANKTVYLIYSIQIKLIIPRFIQQQHLIHTNLLPGGSFSFSLLFSVCLSVRLLSWGGRLLFICCRLHTFFLLVQVTFTLACTFERDGGRLKITRRWGRRPRVNLEEGLPLLDGMLLEHSTQFIDVDKCFRAVGLSASQTSSQSVPQLHWWQEVRAGLWVLCLEEGQDLRAVLCEGPAVLHKLEGRKQKKRMR